MQSHEMLKRWQACNDTNFVVKWKALKKSQNNFMKKDTCELLSNTVPFL